MAGKVKIDRQKVLKAVRDNPDLPLPFVKESLASMSEPREGCIPFVPNPKAGIDAVPEGKARIRRLLEFLKSLPSRRGGDASRASLYD